LGAFEDFGDVFGGADLAEEVEQAAVVGGFVKQHRGVYGAGVDAADGDSGAA
jgi:hypothetical protein